ncbi:MAG: RnfABCDGE type electron transport complex subunit D [Spirochaetaceae bacterium]|jgi:electron transport complex protein RnfD|nr:RnfABCDGE type electron transport complex subunit D [Spirochaetaceae bacterium]
MAENENQITQPAAPQKLLFLQSSPHIVRPDDTAKIMSRVVIALLPVSAWGIVQFGIGALLNIVVSIAAAFAGEAFFRRITKQKSHIKDCSAIVTGLLLALVIPPSTPLWMTALGSIFAVVVAKEFFGGLGANVFNPALAGRAFLLMSFPAAITTWLKPTGYQTPFYQLNGALDGVTGATPLGFIKEGIVNGRIANWNDGVSALVTEMGLSSKTELYEKLFFGWRGGSIGEVSILLILAGGIFLLATKVIDWRAPVALIVTSFVASCALGMDPVFSVLSGGIVFGAVFMATDYTSTPVTENGKIIFGIGAGLLAVLIRKYGNYPEGASYGILIMNMVTPFLNRLLHKKYGYVKPKKVAK